MIQEIHYVKSLTLVANTTILVLDEIPPVGTRSHCRTAVAA